MTYLRSITSAKDTETGLTVQAHELFRSQKSGFAARKDYHSGDKSYSCLECGQRLVIVPSSRDRLFFRHLPNSDFCELKDTNLSDELREDQYRVLYDRESDKHKDIKHRIAVALSKTQGVEVSSIIEDTEFIIKGNERRRPDVYCRYLGKEVVFEIQLSQLSLSYILRRYSFYKTHGIYLFWILDIENPSVQTQMERDIKYLFSHQNLFSLDDASGDSLTLSCAYKACYIFNNNSVREKWLRKSVQLNQLSFDQIMMQAYYLDYEQEKQKTEEELIKFLEEQKRKHEEQERTVKLRLSEDKIAKIIADIKDLKNKDYSIFNLYAQFEHMDKEEIELLNNKLALNRNRENTLPPMMSYIKNYIRRNPHYLDSRISIVEFLLTENRILIDVNAKDGNGRGCLQELYENHNLDIWMYRLIPALFLRGYRLTDHDREYFKDRSNSNEREAETTLLKLNFYNNLSDHHLIPLISKHFTYLVFIESALKKKMIGTGLKNWVQFVVRIQGGYKGFWYYTKLALKKYDTWDHIVGLDKKGTFLRKIKEFGLESVETDRSIDPLLRDLYPELFF